MAENTKSGNWLLDNKALVGVIAAVLVVAIVLVGYLSWKNSINNEGFRRQREVVQQYNTYQTSLSTCLDNTRISSQVASQEFDQLKNVLTAAVSARYVDAHGQPTTASSALGGGQMISVLQEQYPNIDVSLWKQLMSEATGCRSQVAGVNDKLQFVAASFDTWTHQGSIFSKPVRQNWPNDELKVMSLQGPITGRAALDFLTLPITTGEATQAVQTHTMPSQQLFPSASPTQ